MRSEGCTDRAPITPSPYSQSVRISNFIAASSQVGFLPKSRDLAGPDIEAQTQQALLNLEATLEAAGASTDDVIRMGVYLANDSDFAGMNDVYREHFREPFPARTVLFVKLPHECLVAVDALAVVEEPSAST